MDGGLLRRYGEHASGGRQSGRGKLLDSGKAQGGFRREDHRGISAGASGISGTSEAGGDPVAWDAEESSGTA